MSMLFAFYSYSYVYFMFNLYFIHCTFIFTINFIVILVLF